MEKALRQMMEMSGRLDLVLIVLDARAPFSTRDPVLERKIARREKLLILNKADLADPDATASWLEFFKEQGEKALATYCTGHGGILDLLEEFKAIKGLRKGKKADISPFKIMVAGFPNTGKSSLINRLSNSARVRVGKNPGTTRGKQWISLGGEVYLLDSPGVLPPRARGREARWRLGALGCVPAEGDALLEVCVSLMRHLAEAGRLEGGKEPGNLLTGLAVEKRFLLSAGEPDLFRAAAFFLKAFRQGRLGRISLERPAMSIPLSPVGEDWGEGDINPEF